MSETINPFNSEQSIVVNISIPFHYQRAAEVTDNLTSHNQMAFDIVDAFSQTDVIDIHEPSNKQSQSQIRQLENKLNTILKLLRLLLMDKQVAAVLSTIDLSANKICWDVSTVNSSEDTKIDLEQLFLFELYPDSQLPWPIRRYGRVTEINGSKVTAEFYPVDLAISERFEKWVFQLHRRFIHSKST